MNKLPVVTSMLLLLPTIGFSQDAEQEARQPEPQAEGGGASAGELAMELANPVANLISLPFQMNYDRQIGADDQGERFTLNIQPVIPTRLNDDWNLITRVIMPVIDQTDIAPGSGNQTGLGDVLPTFFFSPSKPTASGWIWGVGPAILAPTGSDDLLTADKWAAGPSVVMLKQQGPWTYGALANHLWSFAGETDRSHVNNTFLQPFVTFATPTGLSYTMNMESTYNHRTSEWTAPLFLGFGQVTRMGSQMVQLQAGIRYYVDSPDSGPEGLGFRLNFVLLYPK